MKWPPQSPDINPLEYVEKIIKKAQNRNPQNIDLRFSERERKVLLPPFCKELIGSCGQRHNEVI